MARNTIVIIALVILLALRTGVRADGMFFQYEGDVIPSPADGWLGDFCVPPCNASIEDGHLNYHWPQGGDFVYIGRLYFDPPPPSLWTEWRFRSSRLKPINFDSCDASFRISFRAIHEIVFMFANAAVSNSGNDIASGLSSTEFHSYRFESPDGIHYTVAVDGKVFIEDIDSTGIDPISFAFGGDGGCHPPPVETRNEWDFLRVGTLSTGELIVAADPPIGFLDPLQYAGLDRFTVTYDARATPISTTSPSKSPAALRRRFCRRAGWTTARPKCWRSSSTVLSPPATPHALHSTTARRPMWSSTPSASPVLAAPSRVAAPTALIPLAPTPAPSSSPISPAANLNLAASPWACVRCLTRCAAQPLAVR